MPIIFWHFPNNTVCSQCVAIFALEPIKGSHISRLKLRSALADLSVTVLTTARQLPEPDFPKTRLQPGHGVGLAVLQDHLVNR